MEHQDESDQLDPAATETDLKALRKKAKKQLKQIEEITESRSLSPWERYRALTDLLEQLVDILELADRRTRFALIIIGALNAVNLILVTRPDLLFGGGAVSWAGAYVAVYITLSLYLFTEAIRALRPRWNSVSVRVQDAAKSSSQDWIGLRFTGNILERGVDDFYTGWQRASIGHLNRETALTVQLIARVGEAKYRALGRLFAGLQVLVFLTAGLIGVIVYNAYTAVPR